MRKFNLFEMETIPQEPVVKIDSATKGAADFSGDPEKLPAAVSAVREAFVLGAILVIVFAVSWASLFFIERNMKSDLQKSLQTILASSHSAINRSYEVNKKAALIWAKNPAVTKLTPNLLELKDSRHQLLTSKSQVEIRNLFEPLLRVSNFSGFFLISNDNISIASSRIVNTGTPNLLAKQADFLDRVRGGDVATSLPQLSDVPLMNGVGQMLEGQPTMFAGSPVRDQSGKVIAVLALRVDFDTLISSIFTRNYFGETGETYAFNRNGLLISESRFKTQLIEIGLLNGNARSVLNKELRDPGVDMTTDKKPLLPRNEQPLTRMAISATAGQSGSDMKGYRDYRGVPVIGAWIWDDDLGFGIASEIDIAEAYATLEKIKWIVLAFSFAAAAGLLLLTRLFFHWQRQVLSAKQELTQHRDHLEEEVAERTAEVVNKSLRLEKALEQEKEYSYLQQKFVSLVSHEFRTPLAIIDGAAQLLLRRKNRIDPDEVEKRGGMVRSAVRRMTRMIETTLYASRIDAGEVKFHPTYCDIRKLLANVCERQDGISPGHNISLSVEGLPEEIFIDFTLVEHIFTNLLSNAIKYAPDSPQIDIIGEAIDGHASISITDKGLGIPEEEQPQIFRNFFRASTAEGINGTGIGLSVSMEFAKIHGGTIDVVSVEGKGSTFRVKLPIVDRKQS